jgi:hypothetical protein
MIIRMLAIFTALGLIALVGWKVIERGIENEPTPCVADQLAVRGAIGSEKESFFEDERVLARFACAGLKVTVDPRGSREMLDALERDNHGYGFAFPSSTPASEKIKQDLNLVDQFTPFSSPMAVATFRPIVDALTRANVIQTASNGSQVVDIAALLDLARNGVPWERLPGNVEYPVRKTVLLRTTDPRDSNSAIMFLSIVSHVANNNTVVTTQDQFQAVLPDLCRLVFDQGTKPETSQVLFNDYLTDGMGRVPMALIYEAQFVTSAPDQKPVLTPDRVLLFPRPTVYSRHTLIPLDDAGRRVGRALMDDPELRRIAEEYGFYPEGQTDINRPRPFDVVDSPSFEMLEQMLAALTPAAEKARRCTAS